MRSSRAPFRVEPALGTPASPNWRVAILISALLVTLGLGPGAASISASSGYDVHQGVDKCGDQSHQKVVDLWNGSPFYNYGLYIGGAQAAYVGCVSTVGFAGFVRSTGFGITPIWDDLQPPCSTAAKKMSSNATTARSQGVAAGNSAASAAVTFGFASFDNLWLDIEQFDESNSSCKAAVHSYVDGWDSVLNSEFAAGVYIAPGNADSLWTLANRPDSIWISAWDSHLNSVWGFSQVPNSHWVNDQRMHQYRGSKTYSLPWGCTPGNCFDGSISVDVDCADAWVAGGTFTADQDGDEAAEGNSPTAEATCVGIAQ